MKSVGRFVALAATMVCSLTCHASELRVLYAEPFRPQTVAAQQSQKTSTTQRLKLDAFGRGFELELEDNSRLLRGLGASESAGLDVFKGTVRDVPGSWVRLVRVDGRYEGAFWDGTDLYAVAASATVSAATLTPFEATSATAIYRLSDTQGGLLEGTCGTQPVSSVAAAPLDRYRSLVGELRSTAAATLGATHEITVAMIGDYELTSRLGSATLNKLISHANIADGIFSSQVGVSIVPTDFVLHSNSADPFSATNASTLLQQLADFKGQTSPIRGRGLAHLVTGRALDGNTIGIAYLDSACEERSGVSLSESSDFIDSALVMAHEIGHNLGAGHDAEAGGACAATPPNFLMAPDLNFSGQLSTCSVNSIKTAMARATCIVPLRDRDVELTTPADIVDAHVGIPFDIVADVRAAGSDEAVGVSVSVELPLVRAQNATIDGGTCVIDDSRATCNVPQIAAGETRRLRVTATLDYLTRIEATVRAMSWNDSNPANNTRKVEVNVSPQRDVRVTINPNSVSAIAGEPYDMTFDVRSSGALALGDVKASFSLMGKNVVSATVPGGVCTFVNSQMTATTANCTLGAIAAGDTRRISMRLTSTFVGTVTNEITVSDFSASPATLRIQNFTSETRAAHDLSVKFVPATRRIAIGAASSWALEVRSNGLYPMSGSKVRLEHMGGPALPLTYPSFCASVGSAIECALGAVAAGASVSIPLGLRADAADTSHFRARLIHTGADDVSYNDEDSGTVLGAPATEVVVSGQGLAIPVTEGVEGYFIVHMRSDGALDLEGASAAIDLPAGFEIGRVALIPLDTAASCVVQTGAPQRATCALPKVTAGQWIALQVHFLTRQIGQFTGSVVVTAAGDADPLNNTITQTFDVAAFVDARMTAPPLRQTHLISQPLMIELNATTNHHVLPDAVFSLDWYGVTGQVSASWPGGSCQTSVRPLRCDLGDLAANQTIPISVTLRADRAGDLSVRASLSSPAEVKPTDNSVFLSTYMIAPVDLALELGQTQVSGTVGRSIMVPLTLRGQGSFNTFFEFEFDNRNVSDFEVSGTTCSRLATSVRCNVFSLATSDGEQHTIYVKLTAAGSLPIRIRVSSDNDSNPGNNDGTITVTAADATAPTPTNPTPSPSSSGGGGGGGEFDWRLLCGLLALSLAAQRRRVRAVSRSLHAACEDRPRTSEYPR